MSIETWFAFIAASMVLTITPGPSILLGIVHSIKYGVKKTVITALGDITANFLQMILVAIGLGVIIATSELAFLIIKWFGVVALLYMGLKMCFTQPVAFEVNNAQQHISNCKLFLSGFFVAAGNPKAIVFYTALFPQFIDPSQPLLKQMAVLAPTMAVLDFSLVMLYALSTKKFLGFMRQHPMLLNRMGGGALVLGSGVLALSNRSSNV